MSIRPTSTLRAALQQIQRMRKRNEKFIESGNDSETVVASVSSWKLMADNGALAVACDVIQDRLDEAEAEAVEDSRRA